MLALLLLNLVAAPQWTADYQLTPKPESWTLDGAGVPPNVVIIPARRKATLEVQGPGQLKIRAFGLMKKSGRKLSDPGKLRIWVGTVHSRTLKLSGTEQEAWTVVGKPRLRVGAEQQLTMPLSAGPHRVSITHQLRRGAVGYALLVEITPAGETPAGPAGSPEVAMTEPAPSDPGAATEPQLLDAPINPPPSGEAAVPPPDSDEPPLAISPTAPTEEPPLVESPLAAPSASAEPGFTVKEAVPSRVIVGPTGEASFYRVTIEDGLRVEVVGPGDLLIAFHAHRQADRPETLEPVVVGVLLDDVLVETLSVGQPSSDHFHTEAAPFSLSQRVTIRLSIPVGSHSVNLSLSDNAVAGASARPQLVPVGTEPPELLALQNVQASSLEVPGGEAPMSTGVAAAITAGLWSPHSVMEPGVAILGEVGAAVTVVNSQFVASVLSGYTQAEATRHIEDTNVPTGTSRVRLVLKTVPILLNARWSVPTPLDPLSVDVAVLGGAILNWLQTRYHRVDLPSTIHISPAVGLQFGLAGKLGPGAFVIRANVLAGLPWSSEQVTDFNPGSVSVLAGYQINFLD